MVLQTYSPAAVLTPPAAVDDFYPSDDGEPMAETQAQYDAIVATVLALERHMATLDRRGTVRGDCALYYNPDNRTAYIAPDVLLAFDVAVPPDQGYAPWVHDKAPDLVMEMASPSTHAADSGRKWHQYAQLGIAEYWQYDPHSKYLATPLQGWRLVGAGYEPIPLWEDEVRAARVGWSAVLETEWGLDWETEALRLWHPVARRWYPTSAESEAERQTEAAGRVRAEEAQQAAAAAH